MSSAVLDPQHPDHTVPAAGEGYAEWRSYIFIPVAGCYQKELKHIKRIDCENSFTSTNLESYFTPASKWSQLMIITPSTGPATRLKMIHLTMSRLTGTHTYLSNNSWCYYVNIDGFVASGCPISIYTFFADESTAEWIHAWAIGDSCSPVAHAFFAVTNSSFQTLCSKNGNKKHVPDVPYERTFSAQYQEEL